MAIVLPTLNGVNWRFVVEGSISNIFADCSVAGMDCWSHLQARCVNLQTETGKADGRIGNVSVNFKMDVRFPRRM
jgi:hypothetical protein